MIFSDKLAIVGIVVAFSGFTVKGSIIYFKTNKDKLKAIFNNRIVRISLSVMVLCTCFVFIPWPEIHFGPQREKIVYRDTSQNHNTGKIDKLDTQRASTLSQSKHRVYIQQKPKKSSYATVKQLPLTAKNLVTAPNYGNQQVGDNNTQNITMGIKPRDNTKEILERVGQEKLSKNAAISIWRMSSDEESYNFSIKIMKDLNNAGYINVIINGIYIGGQIIGDAEAEHKRLTSISYSYMMGAFGIIIPANR